MLFPTHDNNEHLAMIRKIAGPFPRYMKSRARKFFNSEGSLRFWRNGSR